jgi:predicted phage tail protein
MSLGLGIFLIVVGAILTFAVNATFAAINLQIVGVIMMAAGAVVVILGVCLILRKRQSIDTTRTIHDPVSGDHITQREHRDDAV